jgi:hypothetical protein
MTIHLDRSINLQDGHGRPYYIGSTKLTVDQAAAIINATDLSLYVEAHWSTFDGAPVSVEKQIATKVRRLKVLGSKIGRAVTRVERTQTGWSAKLVR